MWTDTVTEKGVQKRFTCIWLSFFKERHRKKVKHCLFLLYIQLKTFARDLVEGMEDNYYKEGGIEEKVAEH